jgi:hypothetical protein
MQQFLQLHCNMCIHKLVLNSEGDPHMHNTNITATVHCCMLPQPDN